MLKHQEFSDFGGQVMCTDKDRGDCTSSLVYQHCLVPSSNFYFPKPSDDSMFVLDQRLPYLPGSSSVHALKGVIRLRQYYACEQGHRGIPTGTQQRTSGRECRDNGVSDSNGCDRDHLVHLQGATSSLLDLTSDEIRMDAARCTGNRQPTPTRVTDCVINNTNIDDIKPSSESYTECKSDPLKKRDCTINSAVNNNTINNNKGIIVPNLIKREYATRVIQKEMRRYLAVKYAQRRLALMHTLRVMYETTASLQVDTREDSHTSISDSPALCVSPSSIIYYLLQCTDEYCYLMQVDHMASSMLATQEAEAINTSAVTSMIQEPHAAATDGTDTPSVLLLESTCCCWLRRALLPCTDVLRVLDEVKVHYECYSSDCKIKNENRGGKRKEIVPGNNNNAAGVSNIVDYTEQKSDDMCGTPKPFPSEDLQQDLMRILTKEAAMRGLTNEYGLVGSVNPNDVHEILRIVQRFLTLNSDSNTYYKIRGESDSIIYSSDESTVVPLLDPSLLITAYLQPKDAQIKLLYNYNCSDIKCHQSPPVATKDKTSDNTVLTATNGLEGMTMSEGLTLHHTDMSGNAPQSLLERAANGDIGGELREMWASNDGALDPHKRRENMKKKNKKIREPEMVSVSSAGEEITGEIRDEEAKDRVSQLPQDNVDTMMEKRINCLPMQKGNDVPINEKAQDSDSISDEEIDIESLKKELNMPSSVTLESDDDNDDDSIVQRIIKGTVYPSQKDTNNTKYNTEYGITPNNEKEARLLEILCSRLGMACGGNRSDCAPSETDYDMLDKGSSCSVDGDEQTADTNTIYSHDCSPNVPITLKSQENMRNMIFGIGRAKTTTNKDHTIGVGNTDNIPIMSSIQSNSLAGHSDGQYCVVCELYDKHYATVPCHFCGGAVHSNGCAVSVRDADSSSSSDIATSSVTNHFCSNYCKKKHIAEVL